MVPTLSNGLVVMDILCCTGLGFFAAALRCSFFAQGEISRFIADFVAAVVALVLAQSYAAQVSNAGMLRGYMIAFLGVGAFAYAKVMAPYQLFLLGIIHCILTVPLRIVIHKLIRPTFFCVKNWLAKQKQKINVKKTQKTGQKRLQNQGIVLYNSNVEFYIETNELERGMCSESSKK